MLRGFCEAWVFGVNVAPGFSPGSFRFVALPLFYVVIPSRSALRAMRVEGSLFSFCRLPLSF
jgi:hypothetical protein